MPTRVEDDLGVDGHPELGVDQQSFGEHLLHVGGVLAAEEVRPPGTRTRAEAPADPARDIRVVDAAHGQQSQRGRLPVAADAAYGQREQLRTGNWWRVSIA